MLLLQRQMPTSWSQHQLFRRLQNRNHNARIRHSTHQAATIDNNNKKNNATGDSLNYNNSGLTDNDSGRVRDPETSVLCSGVSGELRAVCTRSVLRQQPQDLQQRVSRCFVRLRFIQTHERLKCCFTSTETVGLLGTGAQDVHLDFHSWAPKFKRTLFIRTRQNLQIFVGNHLRRATKRHLHDSRTMKNDDKK